MSLYITCPRCHASLKANKLPSGTKIVTCPECRQEFQVTPTGVTATGPLPAVAAGPSETTSLPSVAMPSASHWSPLATVAAILVVGAGIITAIVMTRTPPSPQEPAKQPVASVSKEKEPEKEPESPKNDPQREKRLAEYTRLMIEGGISLNSQRYEDAVSAYTEATKLMPDDAIAKQKLSDAQSGFARQQQAKLDEQKIRDEAVQLSKKGQAAMDEKQYAAAVDFFKLALQKNSSLSEASQGLVAAQAALSRAQLDEKKNAEYEQFMLNGKAALKAGRYADAIRDFVSAQQVVPNDAIAAQFQREAEKMLDGVTDRATKMKEFQQLLDQANAASGNKNFGQAEKIFQQALRLFPNDAAAQQGLEDARKQLKQSKGEYVAWMTRGNAALQVGRIADAVLAYREATKLMPNDDAAARALRQAEALQSNQGAYALAMERGALAMTARQFADAVVAYTEALRIVPLDPPALQGLADAQRALDGDLLRRKDFDRHAFAGLQALKSQRYSEAATELRAALKAMPRNPDAVTVERQLRYADAMASATAALNARRFNDAITQFQLALDVFPGDFAAMSGLNRARQMNKSGKS